MTQRRWYLTVLALIIFFAPSLVPADEAAAEKPTFGLVLHGGAGNITPEGTSPEEKTAYAEELTQALAKGYAILESGGSALDTVEQVIVSLEDSPLFNAGKGAVFTHEGRNELDSSIMDGSNLNAGAAAGVTTVKNPIRLARKIMEESKHVMLAGAGAESFAAQLGLEIVPPKYFYTEKAYQRLQELLAQEAAAAEEKHGTVGVAALDKHGNLAAGTSTGGMVNKRWGRIGDSPVIGAGTYANNATCAVSCTGHGEHFIRNAVAFQVSAMMEFTGCSLDEAVRKALFDKVGGTGGTGGIIAIDSKGAVATAFSTAGMYRAHHVSGSEPVVLMFGEETKD